MWCGVVKDGMERWCGERCGVVRRCGVVKRWCGVVEDSVMRSGVVW